MTFIRIKKIKNKHYAYLVKNRWTKKGSRQKAVGYLGKLVKLDKNKNPTTFEDFLANEKIDISKLNNKGLILTLIRLELVNHSFKKVNDNLFKLDNISFNFDDLTAKQDDKSIVLNLNEGYLSGYTISQLLKFSSEGDEDRVGLDLAKAFVDTGIAIPQEIFVHVFEKIYKPDSKAKLL